MRMIKAILIILLMSAIWSCRTTEYVPVEIVKTDTTYLNKVQRDSIYQQDSIYILDRGDTVLITKTKYLYKDRVVRDTVYKSRVDSIQVPYPVERKLTKWEQFRLDVGGWAIVTVIIIILIIVGRQIYRLYK